MKIHAVPAFDDNYIWIVQAKDSARCLIVDPGQAKPVLEFLQREQLQPEALLITHHHHDHTGGIGEITTAYECPVYGPASETIAGVTHPLHGGDTLTLGAMGLTFDIIDCPGHTAGHIAFYTAQGTDPMLFCGDTLFSAGCGRMFEGNPRQFLASLQRLDELPADTRVYCAHEYTQANLNFACAVEPDNAAAHQHLQKVRELRAAEQITLPSTLALEREINPFLRCHLHSVQQAAEQHCQTELGDAVDVFACVRKWKDSF
ncbi:hydroxyacylglutathione hydrolase [Aliidiomarina sp. Khilg15.8]